MSLLNYVNYKLIFIVFNQALVQQGCADKSSQPKHMLRVLERTVLMGPFF